MDKKDIVFISSIDKTISKSTFKGYDISHIPVSTGGLFSRKIRHKVKVYVRDVHDTSSTSSIYNTIEGALAKAKEISGELNEALGIKEINHSKRKDKRDE